MLLIEWKGKRLLFVGDAEWDTKFKEGKANGAWNVMWHERKARLNAPIDFLKIGHHGSENATPWNDQEDGAGDRTEHDSRRDPAAAGCRRHARRRRPSCRRSGRTTRRFRAAALLVELGKRVRNVRNYQPGLARRVELPKFDEFEKPWLGAPQPWRTDCEHALTGQGFVDVEIES